MNLALSPEAAEHLQQDAGGRLLRIAFTTGCGGSGYRLSYADEPVAEDEVVEVEGVTVALDTMAASRLDGAVIRYDEEEDGFLLDHPDAVAAVWCG
ncbi:MAG TPA: iron-sulfur cluster biosynthesis family protein [Thermoanaerobaculia bacterium]|jgi:Fe-S cluster assembly iron-binding protein IscA|nr:iron-sulfur cluster biosynthesis family protein [Thermoanaerobaculia bacterium]